MPTRVSATPDSDDVSPPASAQPSPAVSQALAVRGGPSARSVSGSKRKRADTSNGQGQGASHRRRTAEPEPPSDDDDDDDDDDTSSQDEQPEELQVRDEDGNMIRIDNDYYDPDQPMEERRAIQRGLRHLQKDVNDNAEELMQPGGKITDIIKQSNAMMKDVKRPGEAVVDSRLLVSTADLSYRKALRLTHGSLAQGLDVDEFVSKCITYMRRGRDLQDSETPELSSTQRRRTSRRGGDEEEEADDGDMMNWSLLGRFAALPYTRRPALSGFLLGPLSVEKKARKVTKRSAPFRPQNLAETRPEVLNASDFAGKKESDLTATCALILRELNTSLDAASGIVEEAINANDFTEREEQEYMHNAGVRDTGGLDLLRFVVNPLSFGQTIENMFYVSFLIRDGRVAVEYDQHGYPSIRPIDKEDEEEGHSRSGASRHQAVMSMDMETWQSIIDTLSLTSPMIPHREEASAGGPGARGWYS